MAVCLALGVTALAHQQQAPRQQGQRRAAAKPPAAAPSAQPKAVFVEACGRCHPIERVTSTRRTRAQWEETINAMVTSRGATLTPEQYDVVLKYLVAEYGPTSAAPAQGAPGQASPNALALSVPGRPQPRGGAGPDDKHIVDPIAAQRGRATYAAGCIQCHGTTARGGDRGANIVRSMTLLHDRYGDQLGPFLRKGHPEGDTASTKLTDAQIADLSHFLHERLNDTLRGSPVFTVKNILTGDKQAGAAYFAGAGGCARCHSPTGDLAGIGKRYDPPTIQQRFLFPRPPGRGPRGGGPGRFGSMPVAKPVTVDVTTASGETVSGVLVNIDDFTVALRDAAGRYRSWKRTPGLTVVKHDPYAAHVAMLDSYTDKNIHDVVAYLESLK